MNRDLYQGGYTWEEWLEEVDARRDQWHGRWQNARLGELRAAFQEVPTPRYVACVVHDDCADSAGSIPYIARACDQAGGSGAVDLRVFAKEEDPGLLKGYLVEGKPQTPTCIVFDEHWEQIGIWGPRPEPLRIHIASLMDTVPHERIEQELDDYYDDDEGRTVLVEFLRTLRGEADPEWRGSRRRQVAPLGRLAPGAG